MSASLQNPCCLLFQDLKRGSFFPAERTSENSSMALSRVLSRAKMLNSQIYPIRLVHKVKVSAHEDHIAYPVSEHKCYPFLSEGPKETMSDKIDSKGIYIRVDMPGVKQAALRLTLKGSTLFFEAEAPVEPEFEDFENSGRKYGGTFEFFPAENLNLDRIQAKISAGVLRLFVPGKQYTGD